MVPILELLGPRAPWSVKGRPERGPVGIQHTGIFLFNYTFQYLCTIRLFITKERRNKKPTFFRNSYAGGEVDPLSASVGEESVF